MKNTTSFSFIASFFLLALAFILFPESIDDAYITLRFSHNLMLGMGPVFNPGEHVEGYSNFLWMVILAAIDFLRIPIDFAMKLLSLVFGLLTLHLIGKVTRAWFKRDDLAIVAQLLFGSSAFVALWSVDGLETMFYTALLTCLIWLLTATSVNSIIIGLLVGAIALTRPEGAMFSVVAIAWLAITRGYKSGITALIPFALIAGLYELFRFSYFGHFLSNTATAKLNPSEATILSGLQYLWNFNRDSGYLILPAALVGVIALKKNKPLMLAFIFISFQTIFLMVSGGDFMYGYRFIVPIVPSLILMIAGAFSILSVANKKNWVAYAAATVLIAMQLIYQYGALPEKHIGIDNLTFRNGANFKIASFLEKNTTVTDTVLLSEAGIIPYKIHANIIDFLGLVSANEEVFIRGDTLNLSYLFEHQPKFVVLSYTENNGQKLPRMSEDAQIASYPYFSSHYHPIMVFEIFKHESFLSTIYYKYTPGSSLIYFQIFEKNYS
jgi:arabinofuranosyltransferase